MCRALRKLGRENPGEANKNFNHISKLPWLEKRTFHKKKRFNQFPCASMAIFCPPLKDRPNMPTNYEPQLISQIDYVSSTPIVVNPRKFPSGTNPSKIIISRSASKQKKKTSEKHRSLSVNCSKSFPLPSLSSFQRKPTLRLYCILSEWFSMWLWLGALFFPFSGRPART